MQACYWQPCDWMPWPVCAYFNLKLLTRLCWRPALEARHQQNPNALRGSIQRMTCCIPASAESAESFVLARPGQGAAPGGGGGVRSGFAIAGIVLAALGAAAGLGYAGVAAYRTVIARRWVRLHGWQCAGGTAFRRLAGARRAQAQGRVCGMTVCLQTWVRVRAGLHHLGSRVCSALADA
jgi:hypothetical protein